MRDFSEEYIRASERERLRLSALEQQAAQPEDEDELEEVEEIDQGFVLEVVERANDRFLSRLDALDTLLVGLLAAALAISGLVIDRYTDLGQGLWPLAVAYSLCVFGLLFGNVFYRPRDAPNPTRAIIGLNQDAEGGLVGLSEEIAKNWEDRQWLRVYKVAVAGLVLVFLTWGTLAAIREKVVNSNHEDHRAGNAPTQEIYNGNRQAASADVPDFGCRYPQAGFLFLRSCDWQGIHPGACSRAEVGCLPPHSASPSP